MFIKRSKKSTFIEKEDNAFRLLNENLIKLSCKNRAELYNGKIENFITDKSYKKYNIIFLIRLLKMTVFYLILNK